MDSEKFKQLQEEPEKESELSYEPFDPEMELKKLDKFTEEEKTSLSKEDKKRIRAERLEEYKEELIKQKQGIAEIQENLEKQIRDNPELSQQELMKTVFAKAPECRLSKNQLNLFEETLNKYVERHQAIREARKKYPNDKEFFRACFGKEPRGVIEIIESPITLYFRCHNLEDYTWIYQEKFLAAESEKATKSELKKADETGGCLIPKCLIPSLRNVITVENAGGKPFESRRTFKHEEQHAIKTLFRENKIRKPLMGVVIGMHDVQEEIIEEFQDKRISSYLIDYLRFERESFENLAKDEILAHYKGGEYPLEKIKKTLLQPEKKGGTYDYFNEDRKNLEKMLREDLSPEIFDENKKTIKKAFEQVFVKEYRQEIVRAIDAVKELENMGKNRNQIIPLLITESLSRWGKLAKRIKKVQK